MLVRCFRRRLLLPPLQHPARGTYPNRRGTPEATVVFVALVATNAERLDKILHNACMVLQPCAVLLDGVLADYAPRQDAVINIVDEDADVRLLLILLVCRRDGADAGLLCGGLGVHLQRQIAASWRCVSTRCNF